MRDYELLLFMIKFRPKTTEEGGRNTPVGTGYRSSWTSPNKPKLNDAMLMFGQDRCQLGEAVMAVLQPLVSPYWEGIKAGEVLQCFEGNKLVGEGEVIVVLREEGN